MCSVALLLAAGCATQHGREAGDASPASANAMNLIRPGKPIIFSSPEGHTISTSQKLNAEQIPTYDPIHMAGHESLGDFIFVPQTL